MTRPDGVALLCGQHSEHCRYELSDLIYLIDPIASSKMHRLPESPKNA